MRLEEDGRKLNAQPQPCNWHTGLEGETTVEEELSERHSWKRRG
jgi:hypothetical protein